MQEIHGTARCRVDAPADAVFSVITNIDRLPEWNDAIESIVERPLELTVGAEWTVAMHPNHMPSWQSRSCVEVIDRDAHRFAYRTVNADGNPSYAIWHWEVVPVDSAAIVTVRWDVFLKTIDRKVLAGPIRKRQLSKEVAGSLRAIEQATQRS